MNPNVQSALALGVVLLTLGIFGWKTFFGKKTGGCGKGCGCGDSELKKPAKS
jgi:hypothetical protein